MRRTNDFNIVAHSCPFVKRKFYALDLSDVFGGLNFLDVSINDGTGGASLQSRENLDIQFHYFGRKNEWLL